MFTRYQKTILVACLITLGTLALARGTICRVMWDCTKYSENGFCRLISCRLACPECPRTTPDVDPPTPTVQGYATWTYTPPDTQTPTPTPAGVTPYPPADTATPGAYP